MGTKNIERSGLDMSKTDNKENKTKELFNKIVQGVQNLVNSGEYEKFLRTFTTIALIMFFLSFHKCRKQHK